MRKRVAALLFLGTLAAHSAAALARMSTPEGAACRDFYGFVNGAWLQQAQIAPERYRSGSFAGLRENNTQALVHALEAARASDAHFDTDGKRLVVRYFASGMDLATIERNGLAALAPLLAAIDGLQQRAQLAALIGELARHGIAVPFAMVVSPDARDKRRYRLNVLQGGLGLPDRDDYSRTDERTQKLHSALDTYQSTLLALSATPVAEITERVAAVRAFESRLAAASMTRVAMRDPKAVYNLRRVGQLEAEAPGLDWRTLFAAAGVPAAAEVNVAQPQFARAVAQLAGEAPLAVWRDYLRLALLRAASPRLPAAFVDAHFAYASGAIRGVERPLSRAEMLVDDIGGARGEQPLGEALGELFVAARFGPKAKARALQMVADIKAAMRARIEHLDWMSAPTRVRAIAKLDAVALKIGYPDRWKRYDGLDIRAEDYAGNWLRAARWAFVQRLADLDRSVDRNRWFTSPHVVNAFAGSLNDIVFPAGILQPPFFDADADDATNYGAIGMVIGHEITHHFDDRGRQFDESGNLADWWTDADVAAYRERAANLARQYSSYSPLPGQSINGEQTLGENISDLGGLAIAFDGLQRALARAPAATVDGFTPAQRFFVSFATIWRDKQRDEALFDQLRTGNHSPARYRVLGTLANFEPFAQAFGCAPDAPMMRPRDQRIVIW